MLLYLGLDLRRKLADLARGLTDNYARKTEYQRDDQSTCREFDPGTNDTRYYFQAFVPRNDES
jgi:hypothetical protein